MKLLPFYKLYSWIIEEMGASTDACLIAMIYSFQENGKECCLSYADIANFLKVSRCNAINKIKKLESLEYITIEKRKNKFGGDTTSFYTVNISKFNIIGGIENDTPPSIENDTPGVSKSIPIIENNNREYNNRELIIESVKKKATVGNDEAEPQPDRAKELTPFPHLRLTQLEYDLVCRGFDFKKTKRGSLNGYLVYLEEEVAKGKYVSVSHFQVLIAWLEKDTGTTLDEKKTMHRIQCCETVAEEQERLKRESMGEVYL